MNLAIPTLTPDAVAAYRRDGFLVLRQPFGAGWTASLSAAIDEVIASPSILGRYLSRRRRGLVHDLFLWKRSPAVRDLVFGSGAAAIAAQVLDSPRVNFFYDQLFVKEPGCDLPTPWHQDLSFWPVTGEQLCSLWIPLDPVSAGTSNLEYVRGSHRWPGRFKAQSLERNPRLEGSSLEEAPDVEADRGRYDIVSWDMEPGDALLFHPLLLHGSRGNASQARRRRALALRWAGEDVRYAPRPAAMPLLWEHGLKPGDPLGGPLFPQVHPWLEAPLGASEPPRWPLLLRAAVSQAAAHTWAALGRAA